MTTDEHLNKIVAKCRANLMLATQRTQGEWTIDFQFGWGISYKELRVASANVGKELDYRANAAFIAACAGSAEAGWRSTIAAIEWILTLPGKLEEMDEPMKSQILAAWPEELL